MSARIFIHPRCVDGPASAGLAAYLQGRGYDIEKVICGPKSSRGYCELVRVIREPTADKPEYLFERMDGAQWAYVATGSPTGGEAA